MLGATLLLLPSMALAQQAVPPPDGPPIAVPAGSFVNPLLRSGADPAVTARDGFYYYMQTTGNNLTIWKTRDVTDLRHAKKRVVWLPPPDGPYSKEIWAPELHYLQSAWYIYFTADSGSNETHRLWVLENPSDDPFRGAWTLKGKLADAADKWAIDPTVFEAEGKTYLLWSGWRGDDNVTQNIFIARLSNPWTIDGSAVILSSPQYPWEKVGDLDNGEHGVIPVPHVDVNEGPEVLQHGNKIFLVYSASGCWTNYYELGMLTASTGSDLLDPASWKKSPTPVFWESADAGAFGTGHNTFFQSPDGKEDWMIYHANSASGQGCGDLRSPRAQRITWTPEGVPDFGRPMPTSKPIVKPSGTP